jgi:hypothetical protein
MIRKILLLASLAILAASGLGCPPPGYASCQNDNDCPTRDGGKLICYNLRCVECHYDDNCPEGTVCGAKNTCEALHKPEKEAEPEPPAKSLEECAKRCKGNAACGDSCREQFKK